MDSTFNLVLLVVIGFLAGVVNTVAGGGSLMTLPMLIFLGLPSNVANGTNRIAILIQNLFSGAGFKSKGISAFPFSLYMGISAMFGSLIGAYLAANIVKDDIFNKILGVVMIAVVAYMIFKPKATNLEKLAERTTGKYFWLGIISFFFIGIYGGFIQAGTGIFIILALSSINHFTLVKSNAAKTTIVTVYIIASVAVFAYAELINYKYGLIMAIGNASGAWFASRWSVKKGDGIVKVFLIVVVTVMAIKLWFPQLFSFS